MVAVETSAPAWVRQLSVFVIGVAAVAFLLSMIKLSGVIVGRGADVGFFAGNLDSSTLPVFKYYNRLSLVSALFAAVLTPVFFVGGVLMFRYRESGRRLLVWGFLVRTIWYSGFLIFWIYQLVSYGANPEIFPPSLAWGGLAAIVVSGGIGAIILAVLRVVSTKEIFS